MNDSTFQQPTDEQLAAFVAGDPIAEDEVLRLILPQLYRWAISRYHNLPESDVQSMVNQVVLEACRPTVRYDASRSKLTTYLIGLIQLRVRRLLQQAKDDRETASIDIPLQSMYTTYTPPYTDHAARMTRESFFHEAELHLDLLERDFLHLMRQGTKDVQSFAAILERAGPIEDVSRAVKNYKARLQRRLKMIAEQCGYRLEDLLDE